MLKILFSVGLICLVSCAKLKAQTPFPPEHVYNVLVHSFHTPISYGIIINTQIPDNITNAPFLQIEGYDDENSSIIAINLSWLWDGDKNEIITKAASSYGGVTPTIYFKPHNGMLNLLLNFQSELTSIKITAFSKDRNEDSTWFQNWSITEPDYYENQDFIGNSPFSFEYFNKFENVEALNIATSTIYADNAYLGNNTNASRLRLGGAQNFFYSGESLRGGSWGIFENRVDITNANQPMLLLTRPTTNPSNPINNAGGSLLAAMAGNSGAWGIGSVGDAILAKEGGAGSFKFNSDVDYKFYTSNNQRLTILNNGNIGIGITTPSEKFVVNGNGSITGRMLVGDMTGLSTGTQHKLLVNGSALFTKAVVKLSNNWPDYVFENNYNLRSLQSLEAYILKHKHLPEMPSAAEIEKDGIDIATIQALLTKKIEELTLYIIEQNKKINNLQAQVNELQLKK
jgi:hypothetical protein